MFDFFKRRTRPPERGDLSGLLSFDDISYANAVYQLFQNMDAGTRAHVIVAYENLAVCGKTWKSGHCVDLLLDRSLVGFDCVVCDLIVSPALGYAAANFGMRIRL